MPRPFARRDNRHQQMRNIGIHRHLDHFGIDQQHLDLIGRARHQHTDDERIEAHAFTGTSFGPRSTGGAWWLDRTPANAVDVFTEEHRQAHCATFRRCGAHHVGHHDFGAFDIRYFHADGILARQRSDDAYRPCTHRHRQLALQAEHFVGTQSLR